MVHTPPQVDVAVVCHSATDTVRKSFRSWSTSFDPQKLLQLICNRRRRRRWKKRKQLFKVIYRQFVMHVFLWVRTENLWKITENAVPVSITGRILIAPPAMAAVHCTRCSSANLLTAARPRHPLPASVAAAPDDHHEEDSIRSRGYFQSSCQIELIYQC